MARTPRTGPKSSQDLVPPEVDAKESETRAEPSEATAFDSAGKPDEGSEDQTHDVAPPEPEAGPAAAVRSEPPTVKVERRSGFFPLLLGGVAAGGIGFGAAAYLLPRYLPMSGDSDRLMTLDGEVKDQAKKLTALDAAFADLRAAQAAEPATSPVPEAVANQIADIAAKLETLDRTASALTEKVDSFDARLTGAEQRPVTGDAASASALDAFQNEMEAFRAEIAAQKQAAEAAKGDIAAAASAAAATIESVKTDAEKLRSEAEAAARSATINAAIGRIEAALESGATLSEPLADLSAAGVDVPATLADQAQGVPTLAALRDSFPAAARMALAISAKETAGSDVWSRMSAFFRSQSGARSLAPRAGDDPDAVLSRAEANLRAGDLASAIAELKALPEAGQAAMSEWTTRADRRVQAVTAAATLKQQME